MSRVITKTVFDCFKEANEAAAASESYAVNAVGKWVEAGRSLNEAKLLAGHGKWTTWLDENWNYSQSWAGKLMKLEKTINLEVMDQEEVLAIASQHMGNSGKKRASRPKSNSESTTNFPPDAKQEPPNTGEEAEYEPPFEPDEPSEAREPAAGEEYETPEDDGPNESEPEPPKVNKAEEKRQLAKDNWKRIDSHLKVLMRAVDDYHNSYKNPTNRDRAHELLEELFEVLKVWKVK